MNKDEMINLRNALAMIEVKGENTKIMAQCLQFVEEHIAAVDRAEKEGKAAE